MGEPVEESRGQQPVSFPFCRDTALGHWGPRERAFVVIELGRKEARLPLRILEMPAGHAQNGHATPCNLVNVARMPRFGGGEAGFW
jgi:hypothetical protein